MQADIGRESHISWVFFKGDQALKFYKPVVTDVLDYSTLEARAAAAEREVEVNRRFSSDVYHGTARVEVGGALVDVGIAMRRMPAGRRLSALVGTDEEADAIRAVARRVAAIHAASPHLDPADADLAASSDAIGRRMRADIDELERLASDLLDVGQCDDLRRLAHAYLVGRSDLFADRVRGGHVIDGHGDLLADDIFVLPDGVRILDALAFSDRLRHGDVLADLAFLLMDLHRLGSMDAAQALLRWYCNLSDEHHPGSLAHYYVAQRAIVRAKVAAMRYRQEVDPRCWADVRLHAALATDHLERAQIRLVLVGGVPGSGKSTVARSIGDHFGWVTLSSDEVRHDDGGGGAPRALDADDYDPARRERTYRRMLDQAALLMARGFSVVLDATWESRHMRALARQVAEEAGAAVTEMRCEAPISTCEARVARRAPDASDATVEVVQAIGRRFDAWPECVRISTADPPRETLVIALGTLFASPWPVRPVDPPAPVHLASA